MSKCAHPQEIGMKKLIEALEKELTSKPPELPKIRRSG
jgi:hypothetical protein